MVPAGAAGPIDRRGSSLALLKVDTLADALVAARPGAEVYSFSLKDRGALFGGGRHPKLALWLDTEGGTLVTSTAFATSVPAWAAPFADGAAVMRAFAPAWEPLDAGWIAANAATRDDQDGEGDYLGLGVVFPHKATSVKAMRATPAGDRLLLELARGGRGARGRERARAAGAAGAVAVVARLRRRTCSGPTAGRRGTSCGGWIAGWPSCSRRSTRWSVRPATRSCSPAITAATRCPRCRARGWAPGAGAARARRAPTTGSGSAGGASGSAARDIARQLDEDAHADRRRSSIPSST